MRNPIHLFKALTLVSLSLMMVTAPLRLTAALAQVSPTAKETVPSDLAQLLKQGKLQSDQGQLNAALATFQQALALAQQYKLRKTEANTLVRIGVVYRRMKQPQKTIEFYNRALAIWRELNERREIATILNDIGAVYNSTGQSQKALEHYTQAVPIFREVGNRSAEAFVLLDIGAVYEKIGQLKKALEFYSQSLSVFRGSINPRENLSTLDNLGETSVINSIGRVYRNLGQPEKALEYYAQALSISRKSKDQSSEASTLETIRKVYSSIAKPEKPLEFYTQGPPVPRVVENPAIKADRLASLGRNYATTGQPEKALQSLAQALFIFREIQDLTREATTLNNIGFVYNNIGQPEKALESYFQALPILQKTRNLSVEAITLNNIGAVYGNIKQNEKALEYYNKAMLLYRGAVNNPAEEATTLNNIGFVYDSLGQFDKALEYYFQALPLLRRFHNREVEATTLNNIGFVYNRIDQPEKALEYFTQALAIDRDVSNPLGEASALSNIGVAYGKMGQLGKALKYYNQSLSIRRTVQDRAGEATTLLNLAQLSRQQGNLDTALQQIDTAINILETTRSEIKSNELRTAYLASVQDFYKFRVDLLMQLHRQNPSKSYDQLALQASEQARARGLNDLLNEARIDIRQGVDPALLAKERELTNQLRVLETRRTELAGKNAPAEQLGQIERDYNTLQQQYQQNQNQIRAASPRYANLRQPNPLSTKEIQSLLDDNTLLLNYSLGTDRSYLWLVSRNGLTSHELPKAKEIGDLVRRYYSLLTDKDVLTFKKAELEQVGRQLSQILLNPVANQLGQKRLVVVADGALFYLPFAALPLPNGQQPMITQHEIVHLPSATTLALLRQDNNRRTAPKTLALLADPVFGKDDPRLRSVRPTQTVAQLSTPLRFVISGDTRLARLPYTEVEAKNIVRLLPPAQQQSWLGFTANLQNATSRELANYQIIHFATHGIFNSKNPERSGLIFSRLTPNGTYQNGDLTLQEIFNLKLNADLVVLSACQTGLGQDVGNVQDIQGEGLVGLTRGFMYAGAPRLLVSLWSVNDQSTASLMSQFYQNKLAKGMTPAAALRQAQLEMLKNPQYQAPFYWAPFILQGEWR